MNLTELTELNELTNELTELWHNNKILSLNPFYIMPIECTDVSPLLLLLPKNVHLLHLFS